MMLCGPLALHVARPHHPLTLTRLVGMRSLQSFTRVAVPALLVLAADPARAAAQWLPRATPEQAGFSSEALAKLLPAMQANIDSGRYAGIVTVVARHGKLVHAQAVGKMNVDGAAPLTTDAVFRIASMSKPVTTVAALQLVDAGKLRLDDPVSKYIPAFANVRVYTGGGALAPQTVAATSPITVAQLMSHTSGLGYILFNTWSDSIWKAGKVYDPSRTIAFFADSVARFPLLFQPGERWSYSAGLDVLGRVIEVAAGQSFDVVLRERIFKPLGMRNSGFHIEAAQKARVAALHTVGADRRVRVTLSDDTQSFQDESARFFMGGGGLVSTAEDYLRFAQMLLNGGTLDGTRILKAETVAQMTRDWLVPPQSVPAPYNGAPGYGFGLGVTVQTTQPNTFVSSAAGSFGWSGIYNTFFWVDPKNDIVGLVMTQTAPFRVTPLEREVKKLVYAALTDR